MLPFKISSCLRSDAIDISVFLYIADNKADVYPRFGPTMEWDTAAAHAILNALNIRVINIETGREVEYNKENLLNPHFIIRA